MCPLMQWEQITGITNNFLIRTKGNSLWYYKLVKGSHGWEVTGPSEVTTAVDLLNEMPTKLSSKLLCLAPQINAAVNFD